MCWKQFLMIMPLEEQRLLNGFVAWNVGKLKPYVVDLQHVKDPWIYMEVGITGKICWPFIIQFLPSLTQTSHLAWRGAPLEMTEGTKGGAQRACSLRSRCIGEVVPGLRRQSTIYGWRLWASRLFNRLHSQKCGERSQKPMKTNKVPILGSLAG
jgi:hypothetical protein